MNRSNLILLAAMMTCLGCHQGNFLDSDFSEEEPLLNLDHESVQVEAASFYADSTISEVIRLTASRSWSLTASDEPSWLSFSRINGMNLGKVAKEWPVTLTFEDNYGEQRATSLHVTVEGNKINIPVIQNRFEPVLELLGPDTYDVSEEGGTISLAIRSNCRWEATISGTAKSSISKAEGFKSDTLQCIVKNNTDTSSEKESSIVLSAEGLAEVVVNITQAICIPKLEIDSIQSETDVLPVEGDSQLVFYTNEPWTAVLADGSAAGVSLSTNAGSASDKLYVHFPNATLEDAEATVVITTASGLSEILTFTQRGCVFVPFRIWPDNNGATKSYQPWKLSEDGSKLPVRKLSDKGAGTWNVVDANNFPYVIWSGNSDAVFYGEACGLTLGSLVENPSFYIQFPAIAGKVLKEVKLMLGNSDVPLKDGSNCEPLAKGTQGWITDLEGKVIAGGEVQQARTYQKDDDWNNTQTIPSFHSDYHNHQESMLHFILTDSEEGASYRFSGNNRMVIRWFVLYYE